ncbi:protein kinase family protein [Chitinophaga sp. GCM10012297]|uniref:Protein kinase family protein n=1 Tax=Chitinophaga chungangae TaxID=2821488 RepID=A0ABS3YJZ9_9BACT|nr:protein kinase family protein [Chitinophaga chungangae]MBO9154995.1 protein kinase family protein [Chitinophaga chungangae]
MEKYSCFNCPAANDYSLKNLTDLCPTCGLPYGFPLEYFPPTIGAIKILEPLARGFYGATYIGELSAFGNAVKKVVKIIPVDLYRIQNKNFEEECKNHFLLSQNSTHVVQIDPNIYFDNIPVTFSNGVTINCHVVGLEYLDGLTLKQYFEDTANIPAKTIAQISIDLVTLLHELRSNKTYHNDLHPGNLIIENLSPARKRFNEIDENIKVVAIDLGSLNQKTKSHDDSDRIGDLHWIGQCLNQLSRRITDNPDKYSDKDWRLAFLLEEKADFLKPEILSQKQITYKDLINQIKDTFHSHTNPWEQELVLKSFDDAVNAQSLSPWHVASLFVDKDNAWAKRISVKGPQVITGMRGCGKTMLLRALEFHARLMPQNTEEKTNTTKIIDRLVSPSERYVGLYISCVKLLDFNALKDGGYKEIFEPYSKLLIGFAIQAIHSIRHLRDLKPDAVRKDFYAPIATTLSSIISEGAELSEITSDYSLENILKKYLNTLSDGQSAHKINIHPKIAFPQLAEAIKKSSEIFTQSNIYFLLDDVSTRYLSDKNIIKLISELLFQDETCAFKFTTEAQTLEMVIMAPGSTSQAKIGRDYSIFDLGREVNQIIHEGHHEGQRFIEDILLRRAKYFPLHPKDTRPSEILGDETLISIAENIVREEKASKKKDLYHGISALTAVCVGDLGDVITLYELILKRSVGVTNYPVDAKVQNECYLQLCNSRLYDLNRRDTRYLDFVESFADASHHLLVQSAIRKAKRETDRLRQYTSIFINITHGDKEEQNNEVRKLIDAGIFNLQGGPEASRTNRQGLKPQQQFKLVFRKLYGVSKHIGLSSADRFELSGKPLEDWLNNPKNGKNILIKNLNPISEGEIKRILENTDIEPSLSSDSRPLQRVQQLIPFEESYQIEDRQKKNDFSFIKEKLPSISDISKEGHMGLHIDIAIVGLGFEEATLNSAKQIALLNPKKVIFIKFDEDGQTEQILNAFSTLNNSEKVTVTPEDFDKVISELENKAVLCDATGLPKGVIFKSIKAAYSKNSLLYLSITTPGLEYPLDDDVERFLNLYSDNDSSVLLQEIASVHKGETGPYSLLNLLPHYTNISDPRVLLAFASAKHERLYTLLDDRDYEQISVLVPDGDTPREKLARVSAEFSLRKLNSAIIHQVNQNNLSDILEQISKDYFVYFVQNNFPFEIGLTGSKMETIAAAIFSSIFKVSQCWYVKPEKWDVEHFSKGSKSFKIIKVEKNKSSKS